MDRDDLEAEQLGEVPLEIAREREEFYSDRRDAPLYGQPGARVNAPNTLDVQRADQAARDASRAPAARFAADFVVQSVFDVRPINGADWRAEDVLILRPANGTPAITQDSLTYTVPNGRVAILRRVTWAVVFEEVVPGGVSQSDPRPRVAAAQPMYVSIAVAGSPLNTFDRIFRQSSDEEIYALASEGEKIVVTVHQNDAGPVPGGWSPDILVKMYGNLLDVSGREKNFAAANKYEGGVLK